MLRLVNLPNKNPALILELNSGSSDRRMRYWVVAMEYPTKKMSCSPVSFKM